MRTLFTSEAVSMGHPDKVADQISDAVLDAALAQDPHSRVACETMVTTGTVFVAGEITTKAVINFQEVVRRTIKEIGYTDPSLGFSYDSCGVHVTVHEQSPDISQGVTEGQGLHKEQGAGDQGMMFGYACDETPEMMPMPIMLARRILAAMARLRQARRIPWMKPDSKSQVTVEYDENFRPRRVHTVVVSTQHAPDVPYRTIEREVIKIVQRVIPSRLLDKDTIYHVNPTGRFVIGGPHGDTGLTGRKIIVDTYGGMGRHGGGAFSGKDPSKVDRSAAYMTRYIAKNIVAAKLAKRCELQVSYAIGVAQPLSLNIQTFGTGVVSDVELVRAVRETFDLRPAAIIQALKLRRPIYLKTARYGHFGINDPDYTWERTDQIDTLRKAVGV
ncbi:MAG: methionine adenosyltransferase [bacterium]|nr:methionine adenosyltransferase [bacterium]